MSRCIPHKLFTSQTYCVNTNYGNVSGKTYGSFNEPNYSSVEHNDDYSYFKFTDCYSVTIIDVRGIYLIKCTYPEGTDKSQVKFAIYSHTTDISLADGTQINKNYDSEHHIQVIWTSPTVCWVMLAAQQLITKIKHLAGGWASGIRTNIACTCEFFKMYDELCVTDNDYANWFRDQLVTTTETKTLNLGTVTLEKLSDTTKKIATDKGWTLV